MSEQMDRAKRLQDMMYTPGWRDLETMLNEQAKEPEDELYEIMSKKPDTLTSKTALKYAIRSRALRDFMESLKDEVKLLDGKK